jgi:hypothetical protein
LFLKTLWSDRFRVGTYATQRYGFVVVGELCFLHVQQPKVFSLASWIKLNACFLICAFQILAQKLQRFCLGVVQGVHSLFLCSLFVSLIFELAFAILRMQRPHRYRTFQLLYLTRIFTCIIPRILLQYSNFIVD